MSVIPKLNENEFPLWKDYLDEACGIHLSPQKSYLISGKLFPVLKKHHCKDYSELLSKAKADLSQALETEIIEAMTTNETLWFRDIRPFTILEEVLLKELSKQPKIKIWCAASSYGQEPYSIALTVLEMQRKGFLISPQKVSIVATDIDQQVLNIAKAGMYDSLAISRGLSLEMRNRYFEASGKMWKLKDNVRNMVKFQKLNLKDSFSLLGKKDVVFCRNVCIYFSEKLKKDIFKRISTILKPSGYFLLGAAESLSTYSNDYQLLSHSGGIYYKVK